MKPYLPLLLLATAAVSAPSLFAQDVQYDDICIRNSPNPITLDTGYTAAGTPKGDKPPTMRDIDIHNVRITGGGKFSFNGYDHDHRVAATLSNVLITDSPAEYKFSLHHADLMLGPGAINIPFASAREVEDSTIRGKFTAGAPASCTDKFVPFPAQ